MAVLMDSRVFFGAPGQPEAAGYKTHCISDETPKIEESVPSGNGNVHCTLRKVIVMLQLCDSPAIVKRPARGGGERCRSCRDLLPGEKSFRKTGFFDGNFEHGFTFSISRFFFRGGFREMYCRAKVRYVSIVS